MLIIILLEGKEHSKALSSFSGQGKTNMYTPAK